MAKLKDHIGELMATGNRAWASGLGWAERMLATR